MTVKPIFAWYDLWIGFFWDSKKKLLYFFPIPMFGLILKFTPKYDYKPIKCKHKWETFVIDPMKNIMGSQQIELCVKCHCYKSGIGTEPLRDYDVYRLKQRYPEKFKV